MLLRLGRAFRSGLAPAPPLPLLSFPCAVLALLALAGGGCALAPRAEYSPAAMRREVLRRTSDLAAAEVVVPFEVDEESVARARRLLRGRRDAEARARGLVDALSASEGFGLHYAWAETASAAETLARGSGNCFALSSALIGLARGLGLKAFYVEVVVAEPVWRVDADVAVYADHIAAVILTRSGRFFVDYSGRLAQGHSVRPIGDLEALAHYYNNIGYEVLHRADRAGAELPWAEARRDFAIATQIHPGLARAWNNLGVARARQGDSAGARDAYRVALELRQDIQSTHLNLALLAMREGFVAEAVQHLRAAERLDPRNPQIEELLGTLGALPHGSEPALGG